MEFFDSKTISDIATQKEWVETMETALQILTTGEYVMPKRMHLDYGKNTFLIMPCITDEYWATKLVSFCPDNKEKGRPSIYGTVVLNSAKTGEPLAIMDGGMITAMRTAAVTAAGIKHLAPPDSHSLGIIGTGVQGIYQAIFACSVRRIDEIWAFDMNDSNLKRFKADMNSRHPDIIINLANDSDHVALKSQVIISATNSQNPVLNNSRELFTGKTFVGIGSYKPDCMEFPEQLFRQLDQIFVDTMDGKDESGDLINPVLNNWISGKNIFPLGGLITGSIVPSENPTRLFKTVGSAIFDLFAAMLVYEKQISKKKKSGND
jgi:ornithine cyclodeaminase/alanine dehydrogenase-like protein (mu-crystallin family)